MLNEDESNASLQPREIQLIGEFVAVANHVEADSTCKRIAYLVANELRQIAADESGWEQLFLDPNDGRLWERTYPHGDRQGGGPPMLRHVVLEAITEKYKLNQG